MARGIGTGCLAGSRRLRRYGTKDARKAILKLQEKGVRFFALIHDLDSLRQSMVYAEGVSSNVLFEDNDFLKVFDRIICHNASMRNYLVSKGFDAEKLISLNLFDYLIPDEVSENKNQSGLVVAGNLSEKKCPYIYLLADDLNQEPLRAYGLNFNASANPKGNIDYCGSFTPEELPAKLQGRFGVIWDGTSIDSCEGAAGGYLRYNNPHKLSLYIASSLPVIAWSEAAIAPLIQKEHIGITVDSLRNVEEAIGKISEEEYREMKKNLEGLRRKVIRGEFFSIAAERAISELSKETM